MEKNKSLFLLITGIVAFFSPIIVFVSTCIWSWLTFFGIGMGVLHYETVPEWLVTIGCLPLLIGPLMCCAFFVLNVINRKEDMARVGMLLSAVGAILNVLMIIGMCYIGSKY